MADYTLVNLREVEDTAPKGGLAPNLEARFAREPLELRRSGLSYQRLAPNFRMPFGHRHGEQEEVYVVLDGSGRARLGDTEVELHTWDALRVPGEVTRSFEAGPHGVALLVFGAPSNGNRDVQMVPGWWGD
jgi:mannose-6-phosphate isomerase-like protein (cupin superfamily)